MRLRDLDDRFLPDLARRLDELIGRIPDPVPEPEGPLPVIKRLRRVDDRWTSKGPLALVRDVPQLGAIVIGVLVLVNAVTVAARTDRDQPSATEATQEENPDGTEDPGEDGRIGPDIGENVPAYIARANQRLARAAVQQPDGMTVAVISFTSYLRPEQVAQVVGPMQVRRVLYRAPVPLGLTKTHNAGVEDLVRDSRKEFARIAAVHTREGNEQLKIAPTVTNDPVAKREYERDGALNLRIASLLKGPCRCIYAVVVRTRFRQLQALLTTKGIRVVDAGSAGVELEWFNYTGLLPEEKKIVTGGSQAPRQ